MPPSSPRQISLSFSLCKAQSAWGSVCDQASSLAQAEGARSCGNALREAVNCLCVCVSLTGSFTFMSTCKIFLGSLFADCLTVFLSLPVEVCKEFCIFA